MITKYYTYDSTAKRLTLTPDPATINGRMVVHPSAAMYASIGAYTFTSSQPPAPPEGKCTVQDGYELSSNTWTQKWKFEDLPAPAPRKFSKMYLELALFNLGYLSQVDAFIDSQTISNYFGQQMPLRRLYDKALVFSEDNQYFSQYLTALQQHLSLTDEQVENILQQCVSEE